MKNRGPNLSRQLQKGNHAFLQLDGGQLQDFVERRRLGDVEFSGDYAPKRREMCAAAKLLAEFVGDAAHISSLRARQAELGNGFLIGGEAKGIDVDQARLARNFNPLARQFVE